MKTIYILLTRSETILSRIVYYFTAAKFTHVSIAFEQDKQMFYSSSRKNGRTMFPAGPCKEPLCGGFFKRHPDIPCAVYELTVTEEVYEKAKEEVEKIMDKADMYHYNILGLILCVFNIAYTRRHHFFCSQFVGEILRRSSAVSLPKHTALMRPMDYMELPNLKCVYRGTVWELTQNT